MIADIPEVLNLRSLTFFISIWEITVLLPSPDFVKIFSGQGEESSPSFLRVDQISPRSPAEQAVSEFPRKYLTL